MRRLRTFFPLRRTLGRTALSAGIIALVTLVLCLLVEGLASVVFVARGSPEVSAPDAPWLLDDWHTEYDPELGWINKPSFRNDQMYGPGVYLQTNSQRFRNMRDFDRQVPAAKVRAVCTGDSFTLGYGVSNDNTWCELLTKKDPRFETVNMGQGGYGVDQAYLWYRRDGLALDHDALIFAFIAEDIARVSRRTFQGYPKPLLGLHGDEPVIAEAPASRLMLVVPSLRQRAKSLGKLRVLQLWQSLFEPKPGEDDRTMSEQQARELVLRMIEDLKSRLNARGKTLLVVLLPIADDYRSDGADALRYFLKSELTRREIRFLDLVGALKNEPADLVSQLFRGHYNELGNSWVAERLYPALIELAQVRKRLDQIGGAPDATPLLPPEASRTLEAISLQKARARATPMNELARLMIDGQQSTRWHSGAAQSGGEAIVLDLGSPTELRQIKLDLGGQDRNFGRDLAVDVADSEDRYVEVLRVSGTDVALPGAEKSGLAQLLTLRKSVTARYVRIRQLGRAQQNYWSVAEIEVFKEKN